MGIPSEAVPARVGFILGMPGAGADYFRRWHRNKNNSGGLMVHKATHHFDLVNWWLASKPVTVMAMGDLDFYGIEQRAV